MTPVVLLAAPASGQGKTTATCALAAALRARGRTVRVGKVGPDYLDPTWHRVVSGAPARNLDLWMMGEHAVRRSLGRLAHGADVVLVEGMMGLFDGEAPGSLRGSTAALARALDLPVVLVVDASGMAGSIRALVEGFAHHVDGVRVVGCLANRVSAPHADLLREALRGSGIAFLGGLTDDPAAALPERHLGLRAAEADPRARTTAGRGRLCHALAGLGAVLDLDGLVALGRPVAPVAPVRPPASRARIGVALDAAFHFVYPDTLDRLRAAGAAIVPVSPLADAALPDDLDGLFLSGGYPEVHAAELAANDTFRASVRALADAGRPIHAECGGLMYLGEGLLDLDGAAHAMCGVLPLVAEMTEGLQQLGWRAVTTTRDTPLGPPGTTLRGHAFHHSRLLDPELPTAYAWRAGPRSDTCGYIQRNVLASWIHVHFASAPAALPAFVDRAVSTRG